MNWLRISAPPAVPADPEVVIRQARARQRRRRQWTAVIVTAVLVAGAVGYLAAGRPGGAKPVHRRAGVPRGPGGPVPSVNIAAFAGHGELAFVSRGTLWVLDGATRTLRRVAPPDMRPSSPVFSVDGRWLAFAAITPNPKVPAALASTVWLAHGDGSGAHPLGARLGMIGGWSPAADVLAVTAGNTIRVMSRSGQARTLARAPGLESAAWSPTGRALAVATGSASASTLVSYPVAGGRPATWLHLSARSSMNYMIGLAGWWRPGIALWALGRCNSCNADGDPFFVIPAPGARPRLLGTTLAGSGVAAAATGSLALVNSSPSGLGRLIWQGKHLGVCGPRATGCASVPSPPGTVTLDPAWSPGGTTLAFVRAPARASPAFPQPVVARWYDAHQLWLYHPVTRSLRRLDATGAADPAWSANGQSLLYVARDGIWLLPRLSGTPVRIATPLFQPGNWPAYYGQVRWLAQFAWWPG
jgi:hypothetical protein